MSFFITIFAAFSIMRIFGVEPVEPDDISVYDPPFNQMEKEEKARQQANNYTNKGYVLGDDELHIPGTPSNSKSYTAGGNYGSSDASGKGWVYDSDELHVIGLPSDPKTGYTIPGFYGDID